MPDLGIGEAPAGLSDVFAGGDLRRALRCSLRRLD
jgi:hypothetical protein